MKKAYSLLILFFACTFSFAATITATTGNWNNASTWNLNRVPATGDVIVIPAGVTVTVTGPQPIMISGVYLHIYGTLLMDDGKLFLSSPATLNIESGGLITESNTNNNSLVKVDNVTVYHGHGNGTSVSGPTIVNGSTAMTLPVKFVSFALSQSRTDVLVQWSTAQESNSNYFAVERSENGTNWTTIGTVKAAGESSALINYSYTDKNVASNIVYYRIRQVDLDGQFVNTSVMRIRMNDSNTDIKITPASKNTILINFSQQVRSNVVIRLMSSSGQVIARQTVANPAGQVVFSTLNNSSGVYIVNITDGNKLNTSKQVLL